MVWTPDIAKHLKFHLSGVETRADGYSWNICERVDNTQTGATLNGAAAQALQDKIQGLSIQKEFVLKPELLKALPETEKILKDGYITFKTMPRFKTNDNDTLEVEYLGINDEVLKKSLDVVAKKHNKRKA